MTRIANRNEFLRRQVVRRVGEDGLSLRQTIIKEAAQDYPPEREPETRALLFEIFGLTEEPPVGSKQVLVERVAELAAKQEWKEELAVVRGPRPEFMPLHQAVREISMLEVSEEQKKETRAYLLKHYGVTPRDEQPKQVTPADEYARTAVWFWVGVFVILGMLLYGAAHPHISDGYWDGTPTILLLWRFVR
jgi:hypothetical protein